MKIGIDFMGGDEPKEMVPAINKYVEESENEVFVFTLEDNPNNKELIVSDQIHLINCGSVVGIHDDPAFVVRKKKDSTLVVGGTYLKEKKIDAFMSAGNTGALIAVGVFVVGRAEGVSKPALPGLFPKQESKTPLLILDLGANIDPTVENMVENAYLAEKYMRTFYKISNPSIKLINIGEEETKGIDLYKETYSKLKQNEDLNFQGNIEPRNILTADCDIILADGWSGNLVLKTLEGTVEFFKSNLKTVFMRNIFTKISGLLIKKDFKNMQDKLDYKELGATPVLGIQELLLKMHGSSDKRAYYNALAKAELLVNSEFITEWSHNK